MRSHSPERSRCGTLAAGLARAVGIALALLAATPPLATQPPPAGFTAFVERGNAALRARDYDTAEAAFRSASALVPEDPEPLLKLGMTLSRKRDFAGAESAYEAVLKLDPRHVQAMNNLANVFMRQDRYEQAADYYKRALAIDPDYLLAVFHYAWIQRQLNRPDEATPAFEHCLEIAPTDDRDRATQMDCRFYLGSLRFRSRSFTEAATLMEQVLASFPGHAEARYYLGMSYRGLGRMDEAREQLSIHRQILDGKRRESPIEKPEDP